MFGSTILDVAAGIIFGFLAISLFTSAAVEAINSVLNVRVKNLQTGIMALVNDPNFTGLAKQLYEHALISPLGPGSADPLKNAPAYIDKVQFAEAMLDITGLSAATPAAAAGRPDPKRSPRSPRGWRRLMTRSQKYQTRRSSNCFREWSPAAAATWVGSGPISPTGSTTEWIA